jgi:hypothetical protein
MTEVKRTLRDSFRLSAIVSDELVDIAAPSAAEIVNRLRRGAFRGEVCIYPDDRQFPRATVSLHPGHGYVVQVFEDEQSWSDFLVAAGPISSPQVEIELGGQALERWPPELFVPDALAAEGLMWFLESGREKTSLDWIPFDQFPREIVWEGREGREAWQKARGQDSDFGSRG